MDGVERVKVLVDHDLVGTLEHDGALEGDQCEWARIGAIGVEPLEDIPPRRGTTGRPRAAHRAGELDAGELARHDIIVAFQQKRTNRLMVELVSEIRTSEGARVGVQAAQPLRR